MFVIMIMTTPYRVHMASTNGVVNQRCSRQGAAVDIEPGLEVHAFSGSCAVLLPLLG